MRVVLDTNILISALMIGSGHPADVYLAWHEGRFTLLTCREQLDELRATLRKPALRERIRPHLAGRLVNDLKQLAEVLPLRAHVRRSPDPTDDFLLALCEAGQADYLVTGDRSGLLVLVNHGRTRILPTRAFAGLLNQ
jgi:uncharacterized protein